MNRKMLVATTGLLMMLAFASMTYANSCPGSSDCPINAFVLSALKAQGVSNTQINMASQYLETQGKNFVKKYK